MSFYEWVGAVAAVISFFSIIGNVLQYVKKREDSKDLRELIQEQYNNYYYIARSLTRARNESEDENAALQLILHRESNYIRGIADSARESLICYGREQLGYEVYFEHPAYPGKRDFTDAVKMGIPIEKDSATTAKQP